MVLPGKHFILTSVFSSVFVREVCTSRLHCSVAASPLLLGAWALFMSFPYPMDGAPGCAQKDVLLLVDLAASWLLKEMQLLSHCFLSCFHTWTELVHVIFVCRMSKVIQSVWHLVLKGSESSAETEIDAPLKDHQGYSQSLVCASMCRNLF